MTDDDLLGSAEIERMLGISPSTRFRWENAEELGFPTPLVIRGRKHWRRGALRQWQEHMVEAGGTTHRPPRKVAA